MATTRVAEVHASKASQRGVLESAFSSFSSLQRWSSRRALGDWTFLGTMVRLTTMAFFEEVPQNDTKYELFEPKPRDTVKVVVDEILPKAISHCYTAKEIKRLISSVAKDGEGRLPFHELQDIILKDQRRRLQTLVHGGSITKEQRKPIPFQTESAKILTRITRKKKLIPPQEFNYKAKLLNGSAALIAPIEMQNLSSQLSNNILLLRGVGSVSDKWDRYCALRQTGKQSYVASRNTGNTNAYEEGSKAGTAVSDLKTSMLLTRNPRDAPKVVDYPPKRQH